MSLRFAIGMLYNGHAALCGMAIEQKHTSVHVANLKRCNPRNRNQNFNFSVI